MFKSRILKNKKLATLPTVNSKLIIHFPAKDLCALSVHNNIFVQTEVV